MVVVNEEIDVDASDHHLREGKHHCCSIQVSITGIDCEADREHHNVLRCTHLEILHDLLRMIFFLAKGELTKW